MSQQPGFSARDQRMIIGFGLFLELVVAYFLLIDGPLTKLGKLRPDLVKSQETLATLEKLARGGQPAGAPAAPLPPLVEIAAGEAPSLWIQQDLAHRLQGPQITVLQLEVLPTSNVQGSTEAYQVLAKIRGPFEAIAPLIGTWEQPSRAISLDELHVLQDSERPELLQAQLKLSYFTRKGS